MFAIIVYLFIVANRNKNSTQAYLFGWAVVIPLVTWLPFLIIEYFELQNLFIKMIPSNLFIAVVPRTIEAMYDTAPPEVEQSLASYIEYYIAGSHHIRDPKTKQRIRASMGQVSYAAFRLLVYFHLLSLSLSALMHCNFAPFESPVVMNDFHFNLDLLHPGHLANAYIVIGESYSLCVLVDMQMPMLILPAVLQFIATSTSDWPLNSLLSPKI